MSFAGGELEMEVPAMASLFLFVGMGGLLVKKGATIAPTIMETRWLGFIVGERRFWYCTKRCHLVSSSSHFIA